MASITSPYEIDATLYESERTTVYRARHIDTDQAVILKVLARDHPQPRDLLHFQREVEVIDELEKEKFGRAIDYIQQGKNRMLVFEDIGAESLDRTLWRRSFDIEEFLKLAIAITDAVGHLHEQRVFHKDINPSNIIWNSDSGQLKLIDFGLSTRLRQEDAQTAPIQHTAGTLPYVSPEQTGRTNRYLDYRTDYYSLGVTLYELVSRRRPFESDDAAELLYAHLARCPSPPHQIRPEIPSQISRIIMKLMSKEVEDRYQSASGLREDLEESLRQLRTTGGIDEFPLGRHDIRSTLQLSQRLYGRQREYDQLRQGYQRAVDGDRLLKLVYGQSGVGKSRLIGELQTYVLKNRGWFIEGKFEPRRKSTPYEALTAAFGELISHMLSVSDDQLAKLRRRVETALRDDAALVASVIPKLAIFLDRPIPEREFDVMEARHRFRSAFRRFLTAICDADHPLTLFVDDLQWIDDASLELLHLLITDDQIDHLFVIGAYRDDEVGPAHPLTDWIRRLHKDQQNIETLPLAPLDSPAIHQMVADTLQCDVEEAAPLAELVMSKTSGNPFFAGQFLTELHRRKLLWFDLQQGCWQWQLDDIAELPASNYVIEVLADRLGTLQQPTRHALEYASLLGTRFSLDMLASVCEASTATVRRRLQPAIDRELIIAVSEPSPVDDDEDASSPMVQKFKFAHDKLQEAASNLMAPDDKPKAHLQIGRLLQPRLENDPRSRLLFDVVEHLNRGATLIDDGDERLRLVGYNLEAAKRALDAQAIYDAEHLLERAQTLLPADRWESVPQITTEVWKKRARALSLLGSFETAENLANEALSELTNPDQRVDFQVLMIRQWTLDAQYDRAIDATRKALSDLDYELPQQDLDAAVENSFEEVENKLGARPIEAITDIPTVDDKRAGGVLRLLTAVLPAASMVEPRIALVAGLKGTSITIDIGIRLETVSVLESYARMLLAVQDFARALKVGQLAVRVAHAFDNTAAIARATFTVGAFLEPWKHHLQESFSYFAQATETGLQSGNQLYAGYANAFELIHRFDLGCNLDQIRRWAIDSLKFGRQIHHQAVIDSAHGFHLIARNLLGETDSASAFDSSDFDSAGDYLRHLRQQDNQASEVAFRIAQSQVAYLYGDSHRAVDELQRSEDNLGALLHDYDTGRHHFYHALALADIALESSAPERRAPCSKLIELRDKLLQYSESCPANFKHKLLLVDAEQARLDGAVVEAMELYRQAITEAEQQGFLHLEALANERAGYFWLERANHDFARIYLRAAHAAYQSWGAIRKAKKLQEQFGHLIRRPADILGSPTDTTSGGDEIDVASVFKASELIISKLDIDELLPVMMDVILENAGARRGAFAVVENGQLEVAVEGEVDKSPTTFRPPISIDHWEGGPRSVLRYVQRTGEPVVMGQAFQNPRFRIDPYIQQHHSRSILCIPASEYGELRGVAYVENDLAGEAFGEKRTQVLQILADHIAIALHKAQLYLDLQQEKERFRQLAENIHEVFWLMDWPSGHITYVSPAYEPVWKRPLPQEPLSIDRWVEPVVSEDRQRVATALREDAPDGEYDETYRIAQSKKSQRWIRDRGFPIRDHTGELYRIAGVAIDITTQHELAEMKEQFVSVVSHELRTPLTPITGILSMMERRSEELPEDLRQMVDLGLRNSRRLHTLIDDLLDIHKLSMNEVDFDIETLDLREVVKEAIALEDPARMTGEITCRGLYYPHPILVEADRDRLLQVFANLLSNAAKFSGVDATIEVEVQVTDGHGQVSIADEGPGIPPEAQNKIFDKFTQADSSLKRRHGGTGLGLAIAKTIVERLGGRIYFETEEDQGTTFFVELPLTDASGSRDAKHQHLDS